MKRDLIKTTAAIGMTEVLLMIVAVARNKYLAISIGPKGLGIYSILASLSELLAVFVSSWLVHGTIKYIAEHRANSDHRTANGIFTFSIGLAFCLAIILTTALIVGRSWILPRLLSEGIREIHYILFFAGFTGLALRPLLLGVLQSMKRVRHVVMARTILAISGLFFIVVLIWKLKLSGFFLSLTISSLLSIFVFMYLIFSGSDGIKVQWMSPSHPAIRKLLGFGGMSVLFAFLNLGSQFYQRKLITQEINFMALGLFQAGLGIMAYLGILQRATAFKFLPKMSENIPAPERAQRIDDYFFIVFMLNVPVLTGTILFSKPLIHFLYSAEFLDLGQLLIWFVLATFMGMIATGLQSVLIGMAKLRIHLISLIFIHGLWVIIPLFFLKQYGLKAAIFGLVAGNTIGFVINYFCLRKDLGVIFSSRTIKIIVLGLVSIFLGMYLMNSPITIKIGLLVFLGGILYCFLTKSEQMAVQSTIGSYTNRFRNGQK